jgi:hypothetical protein
MFAFEKTLTSMKKISLSWQKYSHCIISSTNFSSNEQNNEKKEFLKRENLEIIQENLLWEVCVMLGRRSV